MFVCKLLFKVYLLITILFLLAPIKADYSDRIPGVVLMWFAYLLFCKNSYRNNRVLKNEYSKKNHCYPFPINRIYLLLFSLILFVFYLYYIKFYTGTSAYVGIINYYNNISTYADYQFYFADSGLDKLTLSKMPFIVGGGVYRFTLVSLVLYYFLYSNRDRYYLLSILILSFGFVLGALCKGTFYEIFEMALLGLFVFFRIVYNKNGTLKFSAVSYVKIMLVLFILFVLFIHNKSQRGDDGGCLNYSSNIIGLDVDKNSYIYIYFPIISTALCHLSAYFFFGLYLLSLCINLFWFSTINNFSAFILPMGTSFLGVNSSRDFICSSCIYCGPTWNPDLAMLIDNFGFFGMIICVLCIGLFNAVVDTFNIRENIFKYMMIYFVFLFMISLPIGNLLFVSSGNIISLIMTLFLLFKYSYSK